MNPWTSQELTRTGAAEELEIAFLRGTQVRHQGHISAGGIDKDATFEDADPDLNDALDVADRDKYRRYSAATLDRITSQQARTTTIQLVPSEMSRCHPNGTDHEAAAATSGRGAPRPRTGAGWAARSA